MLLYLLISASTALAVDFDDAMKGFYALEEVSPGPLRGASQAVVSIGGASGFFVSPDGLLLTNAHVAEAAGSIAAVRPAWDALEVLPARLVWVSEALDMALYQASVEAATPYAPLRAEPAAAGEAVAVVGHPGAGGGGAPGLGVGAGVRGELHRGARRGDPGRDDGGGGGRIEGAEPLAARADRRHDG